MKENIIQEKTFNFALKIIQLHRELISSNEYVLSKQLLKSGTSIGANVEEAIGGQSKKDFLSKMSIAAKESRETRYRLKLLNTSKQTNIDYTDYLNEIDTIINIITKIVKTTAENITKK